ncbi:MAG: HAD hydrolase-like protein [Actinomycetota bacterium]
MAEIKLIKLVVLDVAGTTAHDDGLVVKAFQIAMEAENPTPARLEEMTAYVIATMGQRKIDVFRHLSDGDEAQAQAAHERFVTSYTDLIAEGELTEFEGVSEFFRELHHLGIGIGITTGFPREILDPIIFSLGWSDLVDVSVAASEVAQGRPAPDMIFRAIDIYNKTYGLDIHADQVAVAGDTESDMKAGVTAGVAIVLGVTSGAHSEAELRATGATDVSPSVTSLLTLVH